MSLWQKVSHHCFRYVCLALGLSILGARAAAPPDLKPATRPQAGTAAEKLWSLQPLKRPFVPKLGLKSQPANPIDAFVLAKLQEKGLMLSPEADRRTLVRRLHYDLTGLPPTAVEIEAFLADHDPKAYERLVDRLLSSPRYGERWARHWLDVVHFGETHGYDKDQPRPNAWPFRDYVIRSFNEDKPYWRFVQEQVAGDVLFAETRDGVEALGFISAGPWDLIGHAEVPETKVDGKVARHLDRDDMVMNTIQTFNSLTVQCAQCHNHKFDPIPQEDYYSLQAVFAAIDRTDKKYDPDPLVAKQRSSLEEAQKRLVTRQKELNTQLASRAGQALKDLDEKIAALQKTKNKGAAYGYHSSIEKTPDVPKWVQIDLGNAISIGSIVLHPCSDDFNGIGEGFGFPVRFKVEAGNDPGFSSEVTVIKDQTSADFPNPRIAPQSFDANGLNARFIRITATQLALRQNDYIFALAEVEALTAEGRNAALGAAVSAQDSTEAPVRWQKINLTDGYYPGISSATNTPEIAALQKKRNDLLASVAEKDEAAHIAEYVRDLDRIKTEISKLPPQSSVYVGAIHKGSGAFRGTGADGGKPRQIYVLKRGSVEKPGKEAVPGTLSCVAGLPSRFQLHPGAGEGERRAALAKWLTAPENPLTWRSIVNRIWQYHFGRGLVETANDFGNMGAAPSHLELLDWLAAEFRDGGQSLKMLHREIVMSATYRQVSDNSPAFAKLDSDNRLLWRMNRRKLEAEEIRDSILYVAGKLDERMGGPSFRDFVLDKPEHSPHYEYQLHDPNDPKSHRRSIYRFIVRSQQQPFMTTLDCADPSMQVARRNESVSPLQALTLLNNALMVAMSKNFAAKIEKGGGTITEQVRRAWSDATGRPLPANDEVPLVSYAQQFGLRNLCRLLFNLNEFSFVD